MMPDKIFSFIPFLAMTCEDKRPKFNVARVMEIVIMLAAMYYTMSMQMVEVKTELANMKTQITLMESRQYEHYIKENNRK
jgi:hypothetical protein